LKEKIQQDIGKVSHQSVVYKGQNTVGCFERRYTNDTKVKYKQNNCCKDSHEKED
jgi:hypothetical protein